MGEFMKALNRLVARMGRPQIICLDKPRRLLLQKNGSIKLTRMNTKDEHLKDYLVREEIRWKFNLAKATKVSCQLEQMIRLTKQMLCK